jgi:hypothetical protein
MSLSALDTKFLNRQKFFNIMKKLVRRPNFSITDDIRILENVITKELSWPQLAKELGRTFDTSYDRWKFNIRAAVTKKTIEKNISFDVAVHQLLRECKELYQNGASTSPCSYPTEGWDEDMDRKLLKLVSKMGPSFGLMESDFPGFTSKEIRYRYMQLLETRFNPTEDQLLLAQGEKGFSKWQLHFEYFPKHSPYAIATRLKFLLSFGLLREDHILKISKGVASHGRDYFFRNLKEQEFGRNRSTLLGEWAYYEPVDQYRAIWNRKVDVEVVSSTLQGRDSVFLRYLRQQEIQNRYYHLKTTSIPELAERLKFASIECGMY